MVARSVFKAFDITEIIVVSLILSILPIGIGVVIRYLRDKQLERRYRKLAAAEGVELILDELSQISETTELHGNSKAATYGFINED